MSTVPYEIIIPKEKITYKIMRETFHSPSYCPIATHLKSQGYNVLVGGNFVWFYPLATPASICNESLSIQVSCNYKDTIHDCSENEEDFHCTIELPTELAEHGSTYRK